MKDLASNRMYSFQELRKADLFIDAIYEGGTLKNAGDDPISKLLGCGNQGGFRYRGSINQPGSIQLCALYSEMSDPDWPDSLDPEFGIFVYFGDNKRPGHEMHDTKKKGNEILRNSYDHLHLDERAGIPPFFVFTKGPKGRDVIFRGLAVPGAKGFSQSDDLVAVWKTKMGRRFANYRAMFTILDVPRVSRAWIKDLWERNPFTQNAPIKWINWVKNGEYSPLVAPRSREYRTKSEQLPSTHMERNILFCVINFFKNHPNREYAFEKCAGEIVHLMDPNIVDYEITRPWKDGGRDILGRYRIGFQGAGIFVEFALEAKCKLVHIGSGIKETARLISRLRHRQFGIL